jgi:hypothetical protein
MRVGREKMLQEEGEEVDGASFPFRHHLMLLEMLSPFMQSRELAEVISREEASQGKVKG